MTKLTKILLLVCVILAILIGVRYYKERNQRGNQAPEAMPKAAVQVEPKIAPEAVKNPESAAQTKSIKKTEAEATPQTKAQAEPEAKPQATPQTKVRAEAETEAKAEAEPQPKVRAKAEAEPQTKVRAKAETETPKNIAQTKNKKTENNSTSSESDEASDAVNIIVKQILLSHGESGEKAWSMNATKGTINQEKGIIEVEEPRILYFFKNSSRTVTITAKFGEAEQKENTAKLWNDVVVQEEAGILNTSSAIYNGAAHLLTMPDPLSFAGSTFNGTATKGNWDLGKNIIKVQGNVNVHMKTKKLKPKK